ncbi:MAG: ATP-binding domain-containing protein, partial [Oscillospiraceae bacterium]|nr:ATP-binding domain-containing protein [Oscillospiraceae bacterium]
MLPQVLLQNSFQTFLSTSGGSGSGCQCVGFVIIPIAQSSPILLTRNLLYTGMTRAKKMLIIIGNGNIINYMIQNIDTKKR